MNSIAWVITRCLDVDPNHQGMKLVSLEVGEQLGVYAVVGPLGAGGMGEVYRATDAKLYRQVALSCPFAHSRLDQSEARASE